MSAILERLQAREQQEKQAAQTARRAAWQAIHKLALAEMDGTTPPSEEKLLQAFSAAGWDAATAAINLGTAKGEISARRTIGPTVGTAVYRAVAKAIGDTDFDRQAISEAIGRGQAAIEGQRNQWHALANGNTSLKKAPEDYVLSPEQLKELQTHPIKHRIRTLETQTIPNCESAHAEACAAVGAAEGNTAEVIALIQQLQVTRRLAVAKAELTALQTALDSKE